MLLCLVAVQLDGVYAPTAPGPVLFDGADKIVHALIFGLPALVSVGARLRPRLVVLLLALHAPVSEVVQHTLLPGRSGDPWDVVADLTGVALGIVLARALRGWRDRG